MKYELRGSSPVDLEVAMDPVDGAGGRSVSQVIRPNARGRLRRGRIQLRTVPSRAQLRFSASVPSFAFNQATVLALDDVKVRSGRC